MITTTGSSFAANDETETILGDVTVFAATFDKGDRGLPVVTREGYTFTGWYPTDEFGEIGDEEFDSYTELPANDTADQAEFALLATWARGRELRGTAVSVGALC